MALTQQEADIVMSGHASVGLGLYDRARGDARISWYHLQSGAMARSSTGEPLGALSVAEMTFVDDAYKPTQLDRNLTLQHGDSWNGHSP